VAEGLMGRHTVVASGYKPIPVIGMVQVKDHAGIGEGRFGLNF
jgi:hypothetical protein